ncbi:MAG: hypothetical protein ACTH2J_06095 [Candidatus Microbacterium stercoravium]|uniref:Uncharacterized protein n=1 Tax=Candidatus Microbacterium stercoravium TaxID=2838697 RepID=A0A9D2H4X1_9MICO|nr:hypothetical protein [Candidatus Microbacterium stercoravium]
MHDIHTWWPKLSISAKHALVEAPGEPLTDEVREEIQAITGEEIPRAAVLSHEDVEFIDTQREQVD